MHRGKNQTSSFEALWKSYVGFLEGTGKSRSTISSYQSDLAIFKDFLQQKKFQFAKMQETDFESFLVYMERLGLKTNTRRRKLLTVRSLYRYATVRKKLRVSPAKFVRAPERIEKLPWIPAKEKMENLLKSLPADSSTAKRNRILVQTILETGLSVAELCSLQWEDLSGTKVKVHGKRARELKLSKELVEELRQWRKLAKGKFLFPGFNRHGLHSPKMTPRGVELVFHALAKQFGLQDMKPKTLRHYAILRWLEENVKQEEILRRLGVNAAFSLENYRKILNG